MLSIHGSGPAFHLHTQRFIARGSDGKWAVVVPADSGVILEVVEVPSAGAASWDQIRSSKN